MVVYTQFGWTVIVALSALALLCAGVGWVLWAQLKRAAAEQTVQRQATHTARVAQQNSEQQVKELQAQLAAMQALHTTSVNESNSKSAFLANVMHSVAEPMQAIVTQTETLLNSTLNESQRHAVQTVLQRSQWASKTVENWREFLTVDAGQACIKHEPMALLPVVESALEHLADQAYSKGLRLGYFIDPQMPRVILADETRVRQMLLILLENAIKYTQQGDVTLTISMTWAKQSGQFIEFAIADSGAGMSPTAQATLFEAFWQADALSVTPLTKARTGLSLCKLLVNLMQGYIGVQSQEHQGTRIWFKLPLQPFDAHPCLEPAPLRVVVAILLPDDAFTAKVVKQLGQLNVTLLVYSSTAVLLKALEKGELAHVHVISIDMVTLEQTPQEAPALMASLAQVTQTVAWVMTPKQQELNATEVLTQANRMLMLKPLKWSLFTQILRKLTFEPMMDQSMAALPKRGDLALKVLLVEDDLVSQKVAMALLRNMGFLVDLVNNGTQALHYLAHTPCDVVLIDCQMMNLEGYNIVRKWREQERASSLKGTLSKPLVILGMHSAVPSDDALSMADIAADVKAAGMNDWLTKPLRGPELHQKINQFLS
ncbi:ATP-binding protein [Thiomicrorhabdus aquaedulcis]|uniref:ATP-binding response regulator n=1 Tax=Thiomicrorhabdus aquaedulcis TaxID=2211106 RepID=UPI000FD6D203|nr:ATP-binding protein [Thiomicrorhabdus aquaedulcis]